MDWNYLAYGAAVLFPLWFVLWFVFAGRNTEIIGRQVEEIGQECGRNRKDIQKRGPNY
jgi:hypothetical protein